MRDETERVRGRLIWGATSSFLSPYHIQLIQNPFYHQQYPSLCPPPSHLYEKPGIFRTLKHQSPPLEKPLNSFHIVQSGPVDLGAFEPLAHRGEPGGEDGGEKADEDDGCVVCVAGRDGQMGGQAVENAHDDDEQRGEQVAGVAKTTEVKWAGGREDVGAATENYEELRDGVGDVLGFGGVC